MTDEPGADEVTDFVRPFAAVLQEMGGGIPHTELGEKLRDLVKEVQETGRAGTLSLQ